MNQESGDLPNFRLSSTVTDPTITYARQIAFYTKIGNQVTVEFELEIATISGGSGNVQLSGFPFPFGLKVHSKSFFVDMQGLAGVTVNYPMAYDNASGGTKLFLCYSDAGSSGRLIPTNLQAGTIINGVITYLI